MRIIPIVLALVPLLGFGASAGAQCRADGMGAGCGTSTDLHVSIALAGDPPLIWSSSQGTWVPSPVGQANPFVRRTIPLGEIVGLKIAPVGEPIQALSYNAPAAFSGTSEGGTVLMPLLRPKRPARYGGVLH